MKTAYDNIIANIETDLTTNIHGEFAPEELLEIYNLAKEKLDLAVKKKNSTDEDELQKIWHEIVVDFHSNGYWGFKKAPPRDRAPVEKNTELSLTSFIPTFLIPLIFTKTALLFFGINWGNHPGQGYGYGFFVAILFLLKTSLSARR